MALALKRTTGLIINRYQSTLPVSVFKYGSSSFRIPNYYAFEMKRDFQAKSKGSFFEGVQESLKNAYETTRGSIFNLMAKNMNEKDMKKFLSHWKGKLEEPVAEPPVKPELPKPAQTIAPPSAPASANFDAIFAKKDVEIYHPLLGDLVVDYGYKKVYSTSVHALARTPVWKKQRILRPERAALIAEDKIRKGIASNLPGVITLFEDINTKEIGIVDGQHRAGALMILAQRGHWELKKNNVLIEVFPTEKEEDIAVLFRVINAAEPVRLIDLPGYEGEDDDEDEEDTPEVDNKIASTIEKKLTEEKKIEPPKEESAASSPATANVPVNESIPKTASQSPSLSTQNEDIKSPAESVPSIPVTTSTEAPKEEEAPKKTSAKRVTKASKNKLTPEETNVILTNTLEQLKAKYSDMFKPTSRCKVPHVNIDVLRDELFTSNFISNYQIQNENMLLEKLMLINDQLAEKYQAIQQDEEQYALIFTKSFENAFTKAKNFHFFLGMEKQWIFQSFEDGQARLLQEKKSKKETKKKEKKSTDSETIKEPSTST
jgi:hypothetical protein